MAKTIATDPAIAHDSEQLVKIASLVDEIDRETGLVRFVDDLPRPEDIFFSITEKKAAEIRTKHVTTTTGNIYKTADFTDLRLEDAEQLLGRDFAEAISAGGLYVSPEK